MSDILFENNTIVSSGKLILNSKINQIDFSGCDLINVNSFSGNNSAASTISSQNDNNIKLEPDGNGMIIANSTIQAPSFSGNDSADLTISSQSNQNIQLQPDGNGKIISNKTIQAPSFSGNDNNNDLIITTQNSNNIQLQPNGNGKIIADGTIQAPKLEIYNGSNTNEGIFSIITNTGTGTELCYLNIKSQGDDANIGFSSAGSKTLHITNVDDVYIASSGANLTISDQFTFNKTIQAPSFSGKASAALTISSQSNQNIQLQPNGNGKIIANKTIQAPKLEIYNGSNTNEGIFSHIANTDSTELCYLNIKSNGGGANIGFSSPGNKTLHITNNDNVYIASSGAILTISDQFDFNKKIVVGTTEYTSDYRIKTNIEELDENITVINLRPLMYLKEGKKEIGLIAHEIQEVFPFMVSGEKDGEKIQSVNYNNLIGVLINDVKRLTNENKNIKNENINIKSRLELLEDKFNKI